MTYKHGKFYDDKGNVVPLTFGNREQIQLIEYAKAMKGGVFFCSATLRCLCGTELTTPFADGDLEKETKIRCPSCDQAYIFYAEPDDFGFDIPCLKTV